MAIIIELIFCNKCHKRLDKDSHTLWEDNIYCDDCFDEYLESIEPINWFDSE